jgi:hypothetical protein
MDKSAVLTKTTKGVEEIKSRTHGLPQKLRALLIMVDGRVSAGDLLARFGGMPEVETAIDALLAQGFVEARIPAGSGTRAGSTVTPAAKPDTAAPAQTRTETLSALTRFLHDNLGPDADLVTDGLERAKTAADFNAAAERCAGMLGAVRGQAKAQAFRERARAYVDAHLGG